MIWEIITLTIYIAAIWTTFNLNFYTNPVNMAVALSILSVTLLTIFYINKSSCWFPMIFYMLFIGGILIIFLILSSLMPNQNPNNINTPILLIILMSSWIPKTDNISGEIVNEQTNWFIQNAQTLTTFIAIIAIYFLVFILAIGSNNISIRSTSCW